ncbi:unnamed protein product [Lepeophtheirus salmonis]|uniref:(salmon louse) hypothetical protein n=1 Tax=Lepeophtheirus salmonis TaxID=72036 RepID=A0A7R8D173_LEPSM|nr:unnamed protein product [Lepeophtheirus salmonis]CAF2987088.1 unnamed protein product [Lepeophtheirus salmonis]
MGRKIKGRKHHGVRDPEAQREAREAKFKGKINAAPGVKKRVVSSKSQPQAKVVRKKKLLDSGPSQKSLNGEKGAKPLRNIRKLKKSFEDNPMKKKFNVEVTEDPVTGKNVIKAREKDENELAKEEKKQEKRKIQRERQKLRKLKKKGKLPLSDEDDNEDSDVEIRNSKEDKNRLRDFSELQDHVAFNEVVHAPPSITHKNNKIDTNLKNPELRKPASKGGLLVEAILKGTKQNTISKNKKKNVPAISLAQKQMLETERITHLIAAVVHSPKYSAAVEKKNPIMSEEWIFYVWKKSIESLRWIYSKALDMHSTNVIIVPRSEGEKYSYATKLKIPILNSNWIIDSIEKENVSRLIEVSLCTTIMGPGVDETTTIKVNDTVENSGSISLIVKRCIHSTESWFKSLDLDRVIKAGSFVEGCRIFLDGFEDLQKEHLRRVIQIAVATKIKSNQSQSAKFFTNKTLSLVGLDEETEQKLSEWVDDEVEEIVSADHRGILDYLPYLIDTNLKPLKEVVIGISGFASQEQEKRLLNPSKYLHTLNPKNSTTKSMNSTVDCLTTPKACKNFKKPKDEEKLKYLLQDVTKNDLNASKTTSSIKKIQMNSSSTECNRQRSSLCEESTQDSIMILVEKLNADENVSLANNSEFLSIDIPENKTEESLLQREEDETIQKYRFIISDYPDDLKAGFGDLIDSLNNSDIASGKIWRHKIGSQRKRAFEGIVAIMHTSPKRREAFQRLIEFGGGQVITPNPPYSDPEDATYCFIEPVKVPKYKIDYESLATRGIAVVEPIFINELCDLYTNMRMRLTTMVNPRIEINLSTPMAMEHNPSWFISLSEMVSKAVLNIVNRNKEILVEDRDSMALLASIFTGREERVQGLLMLPWINVNVHYANGNTPLILAVQGNNDKIVRLLLEHPMINVNQRGLDGYTALIRACYDRPDFVKILISRPETQINLSTYFGSSALTYAILDLGKNPILEAVAYRKIEIAILLLHRSELNVNVVDEKERTPLIMAVQNGYALLVRLLLTRDCDIFCEDESGHNALYYALKRFNFEMAEILTDPFLYSQPQPLLNISRNVIRRLLLINLKKSQRLKKVIHSIPPWDLPRNLISFLAYDP